MSDTPRTDAAYSASVGAASYELLIEARDMERELAAANERIRRLEARCKRLEEAGDAMASRVPDDHWEARDQAKWQQAKEAKP